MITRQEILNQIDVRDTKWLTQHGADPKDLTLFYILWEKREDLIENGVDTTDYDGKIELLEKKIISDVEKNKQYQDKKTITLIKNNLKGKIPLPKFSKPPVNILPVKKIKPVNRNFKLSIEDRGPIQTTTPAPKPVKVNVGGGLRTRDPVKIDLNLKNDFPGINFGGIKTRSNKNNQPEQRGTKVQTGWNDREIVINKMIKKIIGK